MSREIRFRVWTGREMMDNAFSINPYGSVWDIHGEERGDWKAMQFTGLKDSNSVGIYEEDIVEIQHRGKQWTGRIEIEDGRVQMVLFDGKVNCYFYGSDYAAESEVVGNIHENPELLEAADS